MGGSDTSKPPETSPNLCIRQLFYASRFMKQGVDALRLLCNIWQKYRDNLTYYWQMIL